MTGSRPQPLPPDGAELTAEELDLFRAGWLAGFESRQLEVDQLEVIADGLYRVIHSDERRVRSEHLVTRAELERLRRSTPPTYITREAALASWGIEPEPQTESAVDPEVEAAPSLARTNRMSRRRDMSTRTITGNLAADPDAVQVGRVQIVKLRVLENTGEYRRGEWVEHDAATTHFVEAKFELGENVLATLHKGDAVIVVGYEHTVSWGEGEAKRYGRVLEADAIGPDLRRATATVQRRSAATAVE